MNNPNFKLIAIRPLHGCHSKFLKNLTKGSIYKFYNEYSFKDINEQEILDINNNLNNNVYSISSDIKLPYNLYSNYFNNDISINVSALVGKNGSGKSSLLELFYASCYVISSVQGTIDIKTENEEEFDLTNNTFSIIDTFRQFELVKSHLEVQLFYLQNDNFFCLTISENDISIAPSLNSQQITNQQYEYSFLKRTFLENLFYTISVNYSLYGLNSETMDSWIHSLFHKNDGYQTPLVITPYRNKGNIDVNSELHLSQTRLLSNLLSTNSNEVINNKEVDTLILTLDKNRISAYNRKLKKDLHSNYIGDDNFTEEDIVYEKFISLKELNSKAFFVEVYKTLYSIDTEAELNVEEIPNFNLLCQYIFHKVIKISEKYYQSIISREFMFLRFFSFLETLKNDNSHITLKLRQTLNLIRFNTLVSDSENRWEDEINHSLNKNVSHFKIKLKDLRIRLANVNETVSEDLIPLACFSTTIWVKNGKSEKTVTNLDVLSSGEQHFIQSIQSIIYHLINVNSVFDRGTSKVTYKYVNIILDEIELYFHPEFQRIFLDELLYQISKLNLTNIKGINFLFSTHSPFILSDIPKENTLKIENGNIKEPIKDINTFGANIHDLLDNDFYLNNGFMGEFAKKKIYRLINFLSEKKIKLATKEWNKDNALEFIHLIGEPILRGTLRDLYFEKYSDKIDAEIERLTQLKKTRSNDTN